MNKIIVFTLLTVTFLMAKSYHFKETRYSNAIQKSMNLSGEISFFEDGLEIKYDNSEKLLLYEDGDVEFMNGEEEILLSNEEYIKLAQYFEIILLINNNNEIELQEVFKIQKNSKNIVLTPHTDLKEYMSRVELKREELYLKELKIFLRNSDIIKISIENEIY